MLYPSHVDRNTSAGRSFLFQVIQIGGSFQRIDRSELSEAPPSGNTMVLALASSTPSPGKPERTRPRPVPETIIPVFSLKHDKRGPRRAGSPRIHPHPPRPCRERHKQAHSRERAASSGRRAMTSHRPRPARLRDRRRLAPYLSEAVVEAGDVTHGAVHRARANGEARGPSASGSIPAAPQVPEPGPGWERLQNLDVPEDSHATLVPRHSSGWCRWRFDLEAEAWRDSGITRSP